MSMFSILNNILKVKQYVSFNTKKLYLIYIYYSVANVCFSRFLFLIFCNKKCTKTNTVIVLIISIYMLYIDYQLFDDMSEFCYILEGSL